MKIAEKIEALSTQGNQHARDILANEPDMVILRTRTNKLPPTIDLSFLLLGAESTLEQFGISKSSIALYLLLRDSVDVFANEITETPEINTLTKILNENFGTSELIWMCDYIGIPHKDIISRNHNETAFNIIQFAKDNNLLVDIYEYINASRSTLLSTEGLKLPSTSELARLRFKRKIFIRIAGHSSEELSLLCDKLEIEYSYDDDRLDLSSRIISFASRNNILETL